MRLQRADAHGIDNLAAWLTTVVARICPTSSVTAARAARSRDPRKPGKSASHRRCSSQRKAGLWDPVEFLDITLERCEPRKGGFGFAADLGNPFVLIRSELAPRWRPASPQLAHVDRPGAHRGSMFTGDSGDVVAGDGSSEPSGSGPTLSTE